MKSQTNLEKLQDLLRKMFQFDSADLDFGIYRIMNYKRDVIEKFIQKDLVQAISKELEKGALHEQSQAARELEKVKEQIRETLGEDALDAEGNLAEEHRKIPLGRKYLELSEKARGAKERSALESIIFNHLYSFFNRYYDSGDFMSKRRYSKKEKYAIPYNGEEVYLHWANADQYYIKTGEYFRDYTFRSSGIKVHFKLRDAQVEQDNVKGQKRIFFPMVGEAEFDGKSREIIIPFEYRPLTKQEEISYGKKNQQDLIIKEALDAIPKQFKGRHELLEALMSERHKNSEGESVSHLAYHLGKYTIKNTSDFFIHKNLKGFLERELDFYLKNEVLNLDEIEAAREERSEGWFQIMRVIRNIGHKIIAFLSQIEEFQRILFEKKKFVTETNYCITIGNIPEEFYGEIAENEEQWKEWKELLHINEKERNLFTPKDKKKRRVAFLKNHSTGIDEEGNVYRLVSMAWPNKNKAPDDYFKPVIHPITKKPCPVPKRGWRYPSKTMQKLVLEGKVLFGPDESTQPNRKYLLKDNLMENVPSLLYYGGSDDVLQSNLDFFFENPKPNVVGEDVISVAAKSDNDFILDFFAGSATAAHAVINLNRKDGKRRRFCMIEMGEYFDNIIIYRLKKATFTPEWRDGKPKRMATKEEAERSPRIIKYIRIESYEDALNNISFSLAGGQKTLEFDDYLLKYMLGWETARSDTFLNVEKLASPFKYEFKLTEGRVTGKKSVDLPETFNYLMGLHIKTRRVYSDKGRRYLVFRGTVDSREVVVIWRDTEGWGKRDFEQDKKFVGKQGICEGADEIFVNGESFIPGAKAVGPVFKERMFGGG